MADLMKLGPWVRRFLLEHLMNERNLSRGTQRSYRDTLSLLIPFVARKTRKSVDALDVVHVSADLVRLFLLHLEESRGCAISTRNQRLAAIHALAHFVALHSPEHIAWCGEICVIPFKKCSQTPGVYLEKVEIDALLAAPNLTNAQGQRDHLLLLFLYNTGARRRSRPGPDRGSQPRARPQPGLFVGQDTWKGQQAAPLPPLASDRERAGICHRGEGTGRARLPESVPSSDHALRHL